MRKYRLNTDRLSVESFEVAEAARGEGTVHAAQVTAHPVLCEPTARQTCQRELTEHATCVVNCTCTNAQILCRAIDPY